MRAGPHHHGLRVGGLEPLALQGVERLHVGQVDAERLAGQARARRARAWMRGGQRVGHAGLARHRAAHGGDAGLPARRRQPRRVQLVVLGGRAEVPQDRVALAGRAGRSARSCRAPTPRCACSRRSGCCSGRTAAPRRDPSRAGPRAPSRGGRPAGGRSRSAAPSRPPSWRRARRWSRPGSSVFRLRDHSSRCSVKPRPRDAGRCRRDYTPPPGLCSVRILNPRDEIAEIRRDRRLNVSAIFVQHL